MTLIAPVCYRLLVLELHSACHFVPLLPVSPLLFLSAATFFSQLDIVLFILKVRSPDPGTFSFILWILDTIRAIILHTPRGS